MRKFFVAATSAAVFLAAGASAALAGEVKGPPGSTPIPGGNQNLTAAPANSNSACSYSGLNDFDADEGQNERITQTPHDVPIPGIAGHGTCAGGTNENRTK